MREGRIIDKLNRIMELVKDQTKTAEKVTAGEVNLGIAVVAGADDRTLNKYQGLLLRFGYLKPVNLGVFKVSKWTIMTLEKTCPMNQITLHQFEDLEQ